MTITLASLNSRIIIIIIYKKKTPIVWQKSNGPRGIYFLAVSVPLNANATGYIRTHLFILFFRVSIFFLFLFLALAISVVITHGVGETGSANGTPTDFSRQVRNLYYSGYIYETKDGPAKDQPGISMCTRVQHSSQFNTSHDFYLFFRQTFYFFFLPGGVQLSPLV
jgi:hypothetical protein